MNKAGDHIILTQFSGACLNKHLKVLLEGNSRDF